MIPTCVFGNVFLLLWSAGIKLRSRRRVHVTGISSHEVAFPTARSCHGDQQALSFSRTGASVTKAIPFTAILSGQTRQIMHLVPRKRFKLHQMSSKNHSVPEKRFRRYKIVNRNELPAVVTVIS